MKPTLKYVLIAIFCVPIVLLLNTLSPYKTSDGIEDNVDDAAFGEAPIFRPENIGSMPPNQKHTYTDDGARFASLKPWTWPLRSQTLQGRAGTHDPPGVSLHGVSLHVV